MGEESQVLEASRITPRKHKTSKQPVGTGPRFLAPETSHPGDSASLSFDRESSTSNLKLRSNHAVQGALSFTELPTYNIRSREEMRLSPGTPPPLSPGSVPSVLCQRFQLQQPIGSGGFGRVYEASDLLFGGRYAIKVLHPHIADNPETLRTVVNSLKALEHLQNPGFVRCYLLQRDEASGHTFFPMEFISGYSLQFLMQQRKKMTMLGYFAVEEVLQILDKIAPPLEYIHQRKCYHGNLKPTNILFPDGLMQPSVKLLDMGLRMSGVESFSSRVNAPRDWAEQPSTDSMYYSSNRLQRSGGNLPTVIDDIFSLGVMVYQMLTGELPLRMAPPPSRYNSDLPERIDRVLAQAMHSHPGHSFASIHEFIQALKGATTPTIQPTRLSHPNVKEHSLSADEEIPFSLDSIDESSQASLFDSVGQPNSNKPKTLYRTSSSSSFEGEPKWNSSSSRSAEVNSSQPSSSPARSQSKAPLRPPYSSSGEWDEPKYKLRLPSSSVSSVALHPQGFRLATASAGSITIWNTQTWKEIDTFKTESIGIQHLRWSLNSRFFCFVSELKTVQIWDWKKRRRIQSILHEQPIRDIAISADGYTLCTVTIDKKVHVWNPISGEFRGSIHDPQTPFTHVALDSQGHVMALGSQTGTLELWDPARCSKIFAFSNSSSQVRSLQFVPDCPFLLSGHANGEVLRWNYHQGVLSESLQGHSDAVQSLTVSPLTQQFASSSEDGTLCVWETSQAESTQIIRRPVGTHHLCIQPQGQWMTSIEENILLVWEFHNESPR